MIAAFLIAAIAAAAFGQWWLCFILFLAAIAFGGIDAVDKDRPRR